MLATDVNYYMEVFEFLGICTSEMLLLTSNLEANLDEFYIKIDWSLIIDAIDEFTWALLVNYSLCLVNLSYH